MLFPKDFPEKLRSAILVSEVVGKKVKLKLHGREFSGLCPFHNEKTPSFTVNDQKGFYHCFGCSAHGDVISFVMNSEGLSYPDAVRQLANDHGVQIPKVIENVDRTQEDQLTQDYFILEQTAKFFEENLFSDLGRDALSYLKVRGLLQSSIKKFRLGFAQNSYESLTKFLQQKGFSNEQMLRSGVIGKNEQGKLYDKFRNRVIFPILDKQSRVIAFGGRTLNEELPKYLNSSETDLFKKSQTLYNISLARKAIFNKGYAVVVEGYMDAISLAINGVENVVAGLGTALGENHLKELFYITDKIIICLDGDAAGMRAAKRVSEISMPLINHKKNIHFTFLPNDLDPDDFVKQHGHMELEQLFLKAVPLSEALLEFTVSEFWLDRSKKIGAELKAKIETSLSAKANTIADPTSRKHFAAFFKDALFSLGRKANKNILTKPYIALGPTTKASEDTKENTIDQNIVAMIVKFPHLAKYRDETFDTKELVLTSNGLSEIKDALIEEIENNPALDEQSLIKILEEKCKESAKIKDIVAGINLFDLNLVATKFRILLLKDLLLQVDYQYKSALTKIDEIETHQTGVINHQIKEIFEYRNSLERKILALEQDLS